MLKKTNYHHASDEILNRTDLEHFISIQNAGRNDSPEECAKKWDVRAESWKKERENNRKGDDRSENAVQYLLKREILTKDCDLADLGCGPGRFAAAFSPHVKTVTGFDISEKMIEHGIEHCRAKNLDNVFLFARDFHSMDITSEGYEKAFDLVFSSMSPAIHGMDSLQKAMRMSRKWCCNITHLWGRNLLRERIMREVFDMDVYNNWTGKQFYSLFNILFLLGYNPETSYSKRHKTYLISPDEEYIDYTMKRMMPPEMITPENTEKVRTWLIENSDENGLVREVQDATNGTILWDVNDISPRPDFRSFYI